MKSVRSRHERPLEKINWPDLIHCDQMHSLEMKYSTFAGCQSSPFAWPFGELYFLSLRIGRSDRDLRG